MSKRSAKYVTVSALLVLSLVLPVMGVGGGTRMWEVAGFGELDKGEADGTQISSRGEVSLGRREQRIDLEEVGLVWSHAVDKKGRIYLGTGYDGAVFRVDGRKAVKVANTGQLVVTALALDAKGDLYIGALPDPVIWRVKAPHQKGGKEPVKAEKWATLPEGTKHIWALVFGGQGDKTLYAGTGPEGKLFAMGRDGKPSVYLDTEEEHVLSLALDEKKVLLAGTSPGAKLLSLRGPGRAGAIADFDGTEVRAIQAVAGEIFVAVNAFKKPPAVPTKPNAAGAAVGTGVAQKKSNRDLGDGQLYRFNAKGQMELLWSKKKSHVISLAATRERVLFAGLGVEGKVISVDRDRVVRTELDLDERQVMTLVADEDLMFAATGDTGAAYAVQRAGSADAVYFSPPLDAGSVAQWGRLKWAGRGDLKVQSRSGNTAAPDHSWTDWSKAISLGAEISSLSARYIQFRFSWAEDKDASLVSFELAFRRLNQRAVVTHVDPDSPFPATKKESAKGDAKVVSRRTVSVEAARRGSTVLELSWKVDNPDGDTMRYSLAYQAVGETLWRPITKRDQVLTASQYRWETRSVPEGRYLVKVTADDSPDNDQDEVLSDEFVSVPIVIDNHQPQVKGLAFRGGVVSGVAEDGFSEISGVEYEVDTGPWVPVFPKDGVYDELSEVFEFKLPGDLEAGPHAVGVRTFDRVGNMGTQEIHIVTK